MGGSSGGGSSSQPVDQTITQTQFPAEAKPYYSRLLSRGEAESLQPYGAYPSQRLAEFAPEEQQAFGMTTHLANQGTPWAMQQAQQTAGQQARGRPFEPWTGFQPQMPQQSMPQMRWGNNLGPSDRPQRQMAYNQQRMAPVSRGSFGNFDPNIMTPRGPSREMPTTYSQQQQSMAPSDFRGRMGGLGDKPQYGQQQQQQLIDQQYSTQLGQQQQPTQRLANLSGVGGQTPMIAPSTTSQFIAPEQIGDERWSEAPLEPSDRQLSQLQTPLSNIIEPDVQRRTTEQLSARTSPPSEAQSPLGLSDKPVSPQYEDMGRQQRQTQIGEPRSPLMPRELQQPREFQQRMADIRAPYGMERQQQLGQQQRFGAQQQNDRQYQQQQMMRQPMTPAPQAYGRGRQPWQQDTTLMGANYGIPGLSGGYQNPMQRYMSPYQQGVTDVAKEESIRDADRMRSEIGLNAAQSGSLGGYREGIVESNLNRDLMRNLSDIQTQGLQSGYQNAQQQFGADRAARLGQEGAQLGAAQLLGGFAPQTQQMALQRIGALGGVGGQRRGFNQAGMDIGYEDFLRQQGYPRQQIGFQSNIIRGLGLQPSQTVSSYAQRPGLFQSTLGAGLGALGLYQGMGGRQV